MNDKHINTIFLKIVEAVIYNSQISFNYRSPSGSDISFKGAPIHVRRNKNGHFFLAAKRSGFGYATWRLDKMKNVRIHNESNSKVKAR